MPWARLARPPRPWARPPSPSRRRPRDSCYRSPQFIHSFAARCRYRQCGHSKRCFECLQVLHALAARQLVDLRGHDVARRRPVDSASAASRSARRPGCRESTSINAADSGARASSVLLGDRRQLGSRVVSAPRVAVAGQIHEVDAPAPEPAGAALERDPIEVDQPGLAGRRARAGDLRPAERVDQARLADVGSARQGDPRDLVARNAVAREPRWSRSQR